jgi:Flp pilus assembly pilin Flp
MLWGWGSSSMWTLSAAAHRETVMRKRIARFIGDDEGQDLIEYGLLAGIITAATVAGIVAIGPKVLTYFSTLNGNLP